MTLQEKAAYLKGLFEGVELSASLPEKKLFEAIVGFVEEASLTIADLEDQVLVLSEEVDTLYDELCGEEGGEDDDLYETVCTECGETIYIDGQELEAGEITCPFCDTELELEPLEED